MSSPKTARRIHPPALIILIVSTMMMMNGLGCLCIGPLFSLAGPGMYFAAYVDAEKHKALDERGVDCPGQVDKVQEYYDSDSNHRVRVIYSYDCGTGPFEDQFSESWNEDWTPGQAMIIEALPDDPDEHRRQGESSAAVGLTIGGTLMGGMGACACGSVALLLGLIVWSARNLYRPVAPEA